MSATLVVEDLQTRFGKVRAVDGVSLQLHRGQTLALVGESGCGKSVTALSMMRLLPEPAARITAGKVLLDGEDLFELPEAKMRGQRGGRIAMIFQEPSAALNPVFTIGQQIAEALYQHWHQHSGTRLNRRLAQDCMIALLKDVGMPDAENRLNDYPHQLSGGLKQRAMIAIALAGEPDILIADEPTTALDVTIQAQVLALLKRLQKSRNMAVLLITHDLAVVAEVADQVAVMYAGQIIEQASAGEFFTQPYHPYSLSLIAALPGNGVGDEMGGEQRLKAIAGQVPRLDHEFQCCRFAERCERATEDCHQRLPPIQDFSVTNKPHEHWVRCEHAGDEYVGDELGMRLESTSDRPGGFVQVAISNDLVADQTANLATQEVPLLSVSNLAVHFPIRKGLLQRQIGTVYAVDGIDLTLQAGQTLALVGESGCGKTTVGKAVMQLIDATAGDIQLQGQNLAQLTPTELRRMRRHMQIIFQDPWASMNPRMRVFDILAEGLRGLGLSNGKGKGDLKSRIETLLQQVGLPADVVGRYPHEFSGGQRQRFCIARALAVQPELIVCDEPTSALDVSVQAQVLNLLRDLQGELGLAYLFITHDIGVVRYLAHRVAVMYLGRIVEQGAAQDILNRPQHPYTQALFAAVPSINRGQPKSETVVEGELPSPSEPPQGCHFHPRCPKAMDQCRLKYPPVQILEDGREIRCWIAGL